MVVTKPHLNKSRIAAGAVLVALSGFVPQPLMQQAHADTVTMAVSGAFSSGITMTAAGNVGFGTVVPTASTGKASITVGGGTGVNNAFFNGGVQAAGKISFAAGSVQPVDITVAGFGKLSLTGAGATGTVTLTKVFMSGPFAAAQTLTGGTATATDNNLAVALAAAPTGTTADINVGAQVSWSGNKPVGTFTQNITVTVAY